MCTGDKKLTDIVGRDPLTQLSKETSDAKDSIA